MPWLWNSWDEYLKAVYPVVVRQRDGMWRAGKQDTSFENTRRICEAVKTLEGTIQSLRQLGFTGKTHHQPPRDAQTCQRANSLLLQAVHAGEELLFLDKRLCMAPNDAAYGFRHQKDILEHWDRYLGTRRLGFEIHQFVKDVETLLSGHYAMVQADAQFIIGTIDLPDALEADFRLARNLFSVGFDEVGLLMAGRGLEGVLREIAHVRKISLQTTKKLIPASEADTFDLIETMYSVKWKVTGGRLISQDTKALLHYMRVVRNGGAHPNQEVKPNCTARETAVIVAASANQLWNQVSKTRARLEPKIVLKNW